MSSQSGENGSQNQLSPENERLTTLARCFYANRLYRYWPLGPQSVFPSAEFNPWPEEEGYCQCCRPAE